MTIRLAQPASERLLLKDQAYRQIKDQIQSTTFPPGSFLSERQLTALLGMSKTPIRAALERLEQEGFVTVSPQQGIVVRQLSIKEIADQFELRKALEGYVAQAIAGRLSEKQATLIERNLRQQAIAATKGSVARLVELDTEFHMQLCEVFGNQAILDCLRQHRSRTHRVIFQVMSQAPGRLHNAVKEHKEIFEAIQRGEIALAVRRVEQHLEYGKQFLLSSGWV